MSPLLNLHWPHQIFDRHKKERTISWICLRSFQKVQNVQHRFPKQWISDGGNQKKLFSANPKLITNYDHESLIITFFSIKHIQQFREFVQNEACSYQLIGNHGCSMMQQYLYHWGGVETCTQSFLTLQIAGVNPCALLEVRDYHVIIIIAYCFYVYTNITAKCEHRAASANRHVRPFLVSRKATTLFSFELRGIP